MQKNNFKYQVLLLLFFTISLVQAQRTFYSPKIKNDSIIQQIENEGLRYTVYLLGDIKLDAKGLQNLKTLKEQLSKENEQSALVLMGDVLYPLGLPDADEKSYLSAKNNLDKILSTFDTYKGKVFVFPGNHDWARGRKQGLERVLNLEKYVSNYPKKKIQFLPKEACPGPIEISLSEDIVLVVLDSQWWFQKNDKPKAVDCDLKQDEAIFLKTADILARNKEKKIIFTAHHPLYSVGNHGGYYSWNSVIFPLTDMNKSLYVPLPGFIYTGYRKYFGTVQDLAHPDYKTYRENLLHLFKDYPNLIYASGHEHNLQYFNKDSLHHIISASGSSYIAKNKKKTDFAYEYPGFNKLSFFDSGSVWMTFYSYDAKMLLQKKLFTKPIFTQKAVQAHLADYKIPSDSVAVIISADYDKAGKMQRFLIGDNYRDVWNTKVTIPVFDIGTAKGGLEIIQRGGGMQTTSVRLQNEATGKQYVLRSVDKNIEKALPYTFRKTIVKKPVQDAISASHPFASVTIPIMADQVGVMHTNPKIVWVPNDPRLKIYQKDLANKAFLFEERPSGNWEDARFFGYSKKIVSTPKTIKKTNDKQKHRIDQKAVLKARLFDMLINDWDRHDDQWRWATFKEGKKTIYRPIPRDRDQVYFVNQGLVTWLSARKWAMRKFQGFDSITKDIAGLNYNARYFDRSFLTELSKEDWLAIADSMKTVLKDSTIDKAIKKMPAEVYKLSGKKIASILKIRRDSLPYYAKQYYAVLAKNVDVVGTNQEEYFDVLRQENGDTQVKVYTAKTPYKKSKKVLYSRLFKQGETKEIRLYGLKGKDAFYVHGNGKKNATIRIIGGKGKDSIIAVSKVKGLKKTTFIYDRKDKNNIILKDNEAKLMLSKQKKNNQYNRYQFKYNKTQPLLNFGYNVDDGVFVGAGLQMKRYHFRDSTFHKLKANIAFKTGAFNIQYEGQTTAISPNFDLQVNAELSLPKNTENFFGLGNESLKLTDDKTYYTSRYKYAYVNPMLIKKVGKKLQYGLGAFYKYYQVTDTLGRFIADPVLAGLAPSAYRAHNYSGVNVKFALDTRDNEFNPKRGMHWLGQFAGYYSIDNKSRNHYALDSELSFYASFRREPRVVFAFRFGGAKNFGDSEFFNAYYLGGKTNLRGYKSNRFGGDSYFFQNSEIRFKLANVNSLLINGETGLSIFNDVGRVWYSSETSNTWHNSYGVSWWLVPFNLTKTSLSYEHSKEENLINFKFVYFF